MLKKAVFDILFLKNKKPGVVLTMKSVIMSICMMVVLTAAPLIYADETSSDSAEVSDNAQCDAVTDAPQCGDESLDPGTVPLGNLPNVFGGNPINLLSGNKHQKELDFAVPGSRLVLQRTYNSRNSENNIGLGQGWHHSYSVSLFDAGNGAREIVQSNGSRIRFAADGTDDNGQPLMRGVHANQGYVVKNGSFHEWHLPDGRTMTFKGSYLIRIDWADQQRLDMYYRYGRISRITDETGRVLQFSYSEGSSQLPGYETTRFGVAAGHLSSVTLPDGRQIDYDYDQYRNLTRVRYADGTSREYHYESEEFPNHLTGITDRTGIRASTWQYDVSGRAVSSEHANGVQRLTVEYPNESDVKAGATVRTYVTNALGQRSTYTWKQWSDNSPPLLLSSEGVPCTTCPPTGFIYSYDEKGRLISRGRSRQGSAAGVDDIRYEYDEQSRIVEMWSTDELSSDHLIERREYEALALQPIRTYRPSVKPGSEQVTEIERNERGLPIKIVNRGYAPELDHEGVVLGYMAIERITRLEYENGRLVSIDGPRDDVDDIAQFVWDKENRLITIAMPDSPPMRITEFDELGRAVTFVKGPLTSQGALPVTLGYNAASQVETITRGSQTLAFSFDAEGQLSDVVNAQGRQLRLSYDEADQLVAIEEPNGQRFNQELDEEGRVVSQSLMDQAGELISSVDTLYDAQGLVSTVSRKTHVAGQAHSSIVDYGYDEYNRAISATSRFSAGNVEIGYNAFGSLASISGSSGKGVEVGYDQAGQPVGYKDARENLTQLVKDDFGRVVSIVNPDTGRSYYTYDAAGNPTQWTDTEGRIVNYTWNAADKPLLISRPDGETRFFYDDDTGLLRETSNPESTERYEYDRNARLLAHERVIGPKVFVTKYGYDERGRIQSRQLSDGQSLRYHYYENGPLAGRLRAITRSSLFGLQQEVLLAEIDEDPSDGITGFIAHNGKRTTRTHASDGRVSRIEISDTLSLAYEYDASGRITGIDENGIAQSFAYSNGLLRTAETLTGSYVFNYDGMGNRTHQIQTLANGETSDTQYRYAEDGDGNRLTSRGSFFDEPAVAFQYNANGSPLRRGELRYEYNSEQRPIRVFEQGKLLAEYAYNSFGERIKKVTYSVGGKRITYFLYENHRLTAQITEEGDASNITQSQTLYLQNQPVLHLIGSDAYAVHTDQQGTPYLLSDAAGKIAWQAEYAPFGRATIVLGDVTFNHRLPGQYEDVETGTYYNYLRDYDPDTGRYLTSDPLSIAGGLNTYQYAKADPLNLVDVMGLQPTMADAADLSEFQDAGETAIVGADYARLISYAREGNGLAYFELMHELTNHALYADFASSYAESSMSQTYYLMREFYLGYGTRGIEQVLCFSDRSGIFVIPDVNLFSESLFQLAGVDRAFTSFVEDGAAGLLQLAQGTVALSFDMGAIGILADVLRDVFPESDIPAWVPSLDDGMGTINSGLGIAERIVENPGLILNGIVDPVIAQWAEGRYVEAGTGVVLNVGSMFVGLGATARVGRLSELMIALRRGDELIQGDFDDGLNRILNEFPDDPDLIREAAEGAGLTDEVNVRIAARANIPDVGPLRESARVPLRNEDVLIDASQGLQTRTNTVFDDVEFGVRGEEGATYLYTIDNRGINVALESTPFDTPRGNIVHTNISETASIGGEVWFGPNNTVTINAGSGRFGDGAGITESQWSATIQYWEKLGYNVIAVPFGER